MRQASLQLAGNSDRRSLHPYHQMSVHPLTAIPPSSSQAIVRTIVGPSAASEPPYDWTAPLATRPVPTVSAEQRWRQH